MLLLLLLFGGHQGYTVHAQADPFSLSRQKLLDGLRDVQAADLFGVSREDSDSLVRDLNAALSLQEQANATGSSALAFLSINQSSSVSTRAISLGNIAQSAGLGRAVEGYGASIIAAAMTALLVVESPRVSSLMKKQKSQRTVADEE